MKKRFTQFGTDDLLHIAILVVVAFIGIPFVWHWVTIITNFWF